MIKGSLADCAERFEAIRAEIESDEALAYDGAIGRRVGEIVKEALALESPDTAESLVELLTHISQILMDPASRGLVLNNLGCVEKRRRNYKTALHHLRQAAEEEGGIVAASPTTLLNISAVYSAMQMYAEAASISNHAVKRCASDPQAVSPTVHAAALFNLATALEGSGELDHAEEAYRQARGVLEKAGIGGGNPQYDSTVKAQGQLELRLRNQRGNKRREEWAKNVLPSIIRRAADKSINLGLGKKKPSTAPEASSQQSSFLLNASTPPRRLNPLENRRAVAVGGRDFEDSAAYPQAERTTSPSLKSVPRSGPLHDLALGLRSASGERTTRSPDASFSVSPNSTLPHRRGLLGSQYNSSVREFHVFPVNSRVANRKHKTLLNPTWDTNPLPHTPSVQRSLGKDPSVERAVSLTYIPHHLVPFVADLKYKERTRRTMIATEYMESLIRMSLEKQTSQCVVEEDEARVDLEIDELRGRKVLAQWFKGKMVFVSQYSQVEIEERRARHLMHKALSDHLSSVQPWARLLELQIEEEVARRALYRSEGDVERNDLKINEEAARVRILSSEVSEISKDGIAHGLALWCLEGVVSPASAIRLADPSYLQSSYLQSRHLWFGKPFGYGKQGATNNAAAGGGKGGAVAEESGPSSPTGIVDLIEDEAY